MEAELKFEQLNAKQQAGVTEIRAGRNVMFTGAAGTGKSTLLRYLRSQYSDLQVCASTGIAAIQIGGSTLHSWAGLGMGRDSAMEIAKKHLERKNGVFYEICKAKMLAIDEISMIEADLLDKLDLMLQLVRKKSAPFGGIQMIFIGDFCQLPPIGEQGQPVRFAFEARCWPAAEVKVFVLTEVMRQKERAFSDILSRVRVGDTSEDVRAVLRPRINAVDSDPRIKPVEIVTHNEHADRINAESLAALKTDLHIWDASDWADGDHNRKKLEKDCLAPKTLQLKIGAQVMLLKNLDTEAGLVNGSLGEVVAIKERPGCKYPVVEFTNGAKLEIDQAEWQIVRSKHDVLASRRQIPLRLAYAITAHKAQGATLDKVRVHLKRCFAPGQAYVALSRCKTLEGLFIADISGNSIHAHPAALEFYKLNAA
jgi:ATP-dependent DNA helicase PIF1